MQGLEKMREDARAAYKAGVVPIRGSYERHVDGQVCCCMVGAAARPNLPILFGCTAREKYGLSHAQLSGVLSGFDGKPREAADCWVGPERDEWYAAYDFAARFAEEVFAA